MRQPLHVVIDVLKNHPDNIWVWVITQPGRTENTSINIRYSTAVDWCIEYANKHNGEVPCFITANEIFLGYAPVFLDLNTTYRSVNTEHED